MIGGSHRKPSRLRARRRRKLGGHLQEKITRILSGMRMISGKLIQAQKNATNPHRLCGKNLILYLMYGKYCADYRGYGNVNSALGAMFESIGGNAYPFRVYEEGKKLRKMFKSGV